MSILFKNKYRKDTLRLQNWNYANEGAYFVTICTKNRTPFFGECTDGEMNLTEIGEIAQDEWFRSIEIRPDMNLRSGEFVVMPDHIHGIIMIGQNEINSVHKKIDHYSGNQFGPQSKNLGSIIRGYKSAVTTIARKKGIEFQWQSLFYEHIIRSEEDFWRISKYIKDNPKKWG